MSFKKNENKRDIRYIIGSIFMIIIALGCIPIAISKSGFASIGWFAIVASIGYFGVIMFRNANE